MWACKRTNHSGVKPNAPEGDYIVCKYICSAPLAAMRVRNIKSSAMVIGSNSLGRQNDQASTHSVAFAGTREHYLIQNRVDIKIPPDTVVLTE